jgi:hypothetical protein
MNNSAPQRDLESELASSGTEVHPCDIGERHHHVVALVRYEAQFLVAQNEAAEITADAS